MDNKPELNSEQRAAAFCQENAVVAAGAGSGKTMVLASRFAWLITEKNYRVNEILCLTFTKKAAAQMFRRINSTLSEITLEDKGQKAERAKQALDDFVHARIQTLDSYSTALVRQCASRYGINPNFTIDPDRCFSLALEESLPFLISQRSHPALQRLYSKKRPNDIAQKIFAVVLFKYTYIDRGASLIDDVKKQFEIICSELEKQNSAIGTILGELDKYICKDPELLPDLGPLMAEYRNGKIVFPNAQDIHSYFELIAGLSSGNCIEAAEAHPLQNTLAEILQFAVKVYGLNLSKGRKKDNPVKELINKFRNTIFGEFSSIIVYCMQAGLIYSLMGLMEDLQIRYLNKKRQEGILTFTDITRLARIILLDQQDIRQSEKESFKAIMIDEFQDNNETQKDLLFLLAENLQVMNQGIPKAEDLCPGKLFFVGDEKQSVYLFRDADVSVFRRLKNELQSAELPLTVNYRSSPDLIGAFNTVFGGSDFDPSGKAPLSKWPSVFAPEMADESDSNLPPYEAAYKPLSYGKTAYGKTASGKTTSGKIGDGKMCVYIFDTADKDDAETDEAETDRAGVESNSILSAVETEARFIAERIKGLLETKTKDGAYVYKPDDIAILFRTRKPQHLFEKHLRLQNIPYANEDLGSFFYGGPVNDMMSVLRLAAYPMNRAAYAEMLRSPFAGLSIPALVLCLSIFDDGGHIEPFSDEALAQLPENDASKYLNGQKIYREICGRAREENISTLVSELWYSQGYRYETGWNPQTAVFRELYDYLFHLAVKADMNNMGLAAFTDSIREMRDSDERLSDIEIPLERSSAVRLMTIHKSKGLEFPVVFLCACDRHGRAAQSGDVFDSDGAGITLNIPLPSRLSSISKIRNNFFWERSLVEEKRKRTAELRRLLYVGMTRAEKELYLSGCLGVRKKSKDDDNDNQNAGDNPEDFSLLLKNYIIEKNEKKENDEVKKGKERIQGDSIIDNDTFFGLCLPALVSHIPPEGIAVDDESNGGKTFFSLEEIPPLPAGYAKNNYSDVVNFSNDQKGLNAFLEKAEPFYSETQVITTPMLSDNHLTPSSLHAATTLIAASSINTEFSGEDACDVFVSVDSLLARFAKADEDKEEKFTPAAFGTIAHACVEALLNGAQPVIPPGLSGFLTPKEAETFLDAGKEIAVRFLRSPLGRIVTNAKMRKNEFPFRTLLKNSDGKEIFINGTIDLLFEDSNEVHVVDFKTDSVENPSEHIAQMACYYRAADDLFAIPQGKKCRIWLYYLRSGHVFEMTEEAGHWEF